MLEPTAEDIATLRRAVGGEHMHPFTIGRLTALGWVRQETDGWMTVGYNVHRVTRRGMTALRGASSEEVEPGE